VKPAKGTQLALGHARPRLESGLKARVRGDRIRREAKIIRCLASEVCQLVKVMSIVSRAKLGVFLLHPISADCLSLPSLDIVRMMRGLKVKRRFLAWLKESRNRGYVNDVSHLKRVRAKPTRRDQIPSTTTHITIDIISSSLQSRHDKPCELLVPL
jgi:hypothetical protein